MEWVEKTEIMRTDRATYSEGGVALRTYPMQIEWERDCGNRTNALLSEIMARLERRSIAKHRSEGEL